MKHLNVNYQQLDKMIDRKAPLNKELIRIAQTMNNTPTKFSPMSSPKVKDDSDVRSFIKHIKDQKKELRERLSRVHKLKAEKSRQELEEIQKEKETI